MKDIHEHSHQSHEEHESSGKGATFRQKIMNLLNSTDQYMTDREILDSLGVSDVNNIRPEITRLKQQGRIVEVGKIHCRTTGKLVRRVGLPRHREAGLAICLAHEWAPKGTQETFDLGQ